MANRQGKEGKVEITMIIAAPPPRVWKALTDPKQLAQWYLVPWKLECRRGGRWDFGTGEKMLLLEGNVLEVKRGHRLVHTFRFTGRPFSRVTITLAPFGKHTWLTVVHDRFGKDRETRTDVTGGWTDLISNLKTFLETGKGFHGAWGA